MFKKNYQIEVNVIFKKLKIHIQALSHVFREFFLKKSKTVCMLMDEIFFYLTCNKTYIRVKNKTFLIFPKQQFMINAFQTYNGICMIHLFSNVLETVSKL